MQKHLSPQQPGFLRPLFLMKQPLPLIKWRRHSSGFHQMSLLSNTFEGGAPVSCPDKQPSQRCCSVLQTGLLFVGGSMLGQQVPGSGAKEKNSLFPSLTLRLPKSPSGDGRKTETLTYHGSSPRMCQPQSVSRYWACVALMASGVLQCFRQIVSLEIPSRYMSAAAVPGFSVPVVSTDSSWD